MRNLVFDLNCIIDLEETRYDAIHLRTLMTAWQDGAIGVAVPEIAASENDVGGTPISSFEHFEARLTKVGLHSAQRLQPVLYWDVGFWDHCIWASDADVALIAKIQAVLFPNMPVVPANLGINSPWRNQLCDIMVAWTCIHWGWTTLVTRDKNYARHARELAEIGLTEIVTPAEAVALLELGAST